MRRPALPGLLLVWAALLAWATLPVSPARAQSTIGVDQKDREIADLKKEIKRKETEIARMQTSIEHLEKVITDITARQEEMK